MKRRVTVSIVLCVIVLVMTSAGYALHGYLNTGNHPGLSTLSFAPAAVKKVSDEKDITVRVYPTGEIMPHNDEEDIHEVRLNNIKRGWIVNRYGGNCRLLFEIKDADMDDFYSFYNDCHYYYAEMIPKDRLRITDITARQGEDPDPPVRRQTGGRRELRPDEHRHTECQPAPPPALRGRQRTDDRGQRGRKDDQRTARCQLRSKRNNHRQKLMTDRVIWRL